MKYKISVLTLTLAACLNVHAANVPHYVFSSTGNYPNAALTYPNGVNLSLIVGDYVPRGGSVASAGYIETVKGFITAQPTGGTGSYLFSINSNSIAVGGFCYAN